MKKIIVANWKDKHPEGSIEAWVKDISEAAKGKVAVVVFPRTDLIAETKAAIEKYGNVIQLGSQDISLPSHDDMYDDMPGSFA